MMTTHDLNALAKSIHENAVSKGFWDEPRNTGEVFMLIVSELGEAQEAHRRGMVFNKGVDWWLRRVNFDGDAGSFMPMFESDIKDTFEDEIADVVIRTLDYCWFSRIGIDIVEYEQHGYFEVKKDCNIGEVLMEVNQWLCRAAYDSDGIGIEACLNAAMIILFNLADAQGFDLLRHIELKMKYNATRERLHGKKY